MQSLPSDVKTKPFTRPELRSEFGSQNLGATIPALPRLRLPRSGVYGVLGLGFGDHGVSEGEKASGVQSLFSLPPGWQFRLD